MNFYDGVGKTAQAKINALLAAWQVKYGLAINAVVIDEMREELAALWRDGVNDGVDGQFS